MARRPEVSIWQLEVLVAAAQEAERRGQDESGKAATLSDVAARKKVSRQQVVGALERLAERLDDTALVEERDDGLFIRSRHIAHLAERVVEDYYKFLREAQDQARHWWLRVDGYWAHLATFLADAIDYVEDAYPHIRVEMVPQFGASRAFSGAGLIGRLERGDVDLVIAPAHPVIAPEVGQIPSHRVLLLAALGPNHPMRRDGEAPVITIDELYQSELPLATSPRGHLSRDLIEKHGLADLVLHVDVAGPEPAALAALGSRHRIPIIASDSVLGPGTVGFDANDPWGVPPQWAAISDNSGNLLGRDYAVFHRTWNRHRVPGQRQPGRYLKKAIGEPLEDMAKHAANLADQRLGTRIARWVDYPLADSAPRQAKA